MSQTLQTFVSEVKTDIERFATAYQAKHAENPEQYPLSLSDDNAGLWFEFFIDFCRRGET